MSIENNSNTSKLASSENSQTQSPTEQQALVKSEELTNITKKIEFLEKIKSFAIKIPYEDTRAKILGKVAEVLAQVGRFDEAKTLAQEVYTTYYEGVVADRGPRDETISHIAGFLAQAGRFDEATAFIEKEDEYRRAEALISIAPALAQTGRVEEAKVLAEKNTIKHPAMRGRILSKIAVVQAQSGQDPTAIFEEAEAVARKWSGYGGDDVLKDIALDLARVGRFDKARDLASDGNRTTINPYIRGVTFRDIAEALAQAGQFDKAKALAEEEIEDHRVRSETLALIAMNQAFAGGDPTALFEEAKTTIKDLKTSNYGYDYVEALSKIAHAEAQAGRDPTASFEEAKTVAAKEIDLYSRGRSMSAIAEALAESGRVEEARLFADELGAYNRTEPVSKIIKVLAQKGQFDEAQSLIKTLDSRAQPMAFLDMVRALLLKQNQL